MLKGICVNVEGVNGLKKGETYYLFECGQIAFYVSNFPKENTHLGAYQRSRFELIEEEVFQEDERGQMTLF